MDLGFDRFSGDTTETDATDDFTGHSARAPKIANIRHLDLIVKEGAEDLGHANQYRVAALNKKPNTEATPAPEQYKLQEGKHARQ